MNNCLRQQAFFARRRETEQLKNEQSTACLKYYDKWGRITARHEQWTSDEYYKQAGEHFRQCEDSKLKKAQLEVRRKKLSELFAKENEQYERELKTRRTRGNKLPNECLKDIHEHLKRAEEERQRVELEARLYKTMRNGFSVDSVLLDSKSDNEAMAKMNWLDRQVAAQVEREKEAKCKELLQLKMKEETRKNNEVLLQRRLCRDDEIKELNSFQEKQVAELKARDRESEELFADEKRLKEREKILLAELALLDKVTAERNQRKQQTIHNTSRIKMFLRHRSDQIRNDLKEDIEMLNRVTLGCIDDNLHLIREKFEMQYDLEIQKQSQIEAMFESEAKHSLAKEEQVWNTDGIGREKLLRQIIERQIVSCKQQVEFNNDRQVALVDIKEKHIEALENANQRYKKLHHEQEVEEDSVKFCPKENNQLHGQVDQNALNANVCVPPKFGRKKVVWV